MTGLTPRSKQMLDFIRAYFAEHGCAPTAKEAAEAIGIQIHSARNAIERLAELKLIRRHLGRWRGIELIDHSISCPNCGHMLSSAASQPGDGPGGYTPPSPAAGANLSGEVSSHD